MNENTAHGNYFVSHADQEVPLALSTPFAVSETGTDNCWPSRTRWSFDGRRSRTCYGLISVTALRRSHVTANARYCNFVFSFFSLWFISRFLCSFLTSRRLQRTKTVKKCYLSLAFVPSFILCRKPRFNTPGFQFNTIRARSNSFPCWRLPIQSPSVWLFRVANFAEFASLHVLVQDSTLCS